MSGDKKFSLIDSIKLASSGVLRVIKTERNMKIHLLIALMVILAGFFFGLSLLEWSIIILIISAVLAAVIFNAALEQTCDYLDEKFNLKFGETKLARDMAAGAVWLLAIASMIIGLLIFLPHLISFY